MYASLVLLLVSQALAQSLDANNSVPSSSKTIPAVIPIATVAINHLSTISTLSSVSSLPLSESSSTGLSNEMLPSSKPSLPSLTRFADQTQLSSVFVGSSQAPDMDSLRKLTSASVLNSSVTPTRPHIFTSIVSASSATAIKTFASRSSEFESDYSSHIFKITSAANITTQFSSSFSLSKSEKDSVYSSVLLGASNTAQTPSSSVASSLASLVLNSTSHGISSMDKISSILTHQSTPVASNEFSSRKPNSANGNTATALYSRYTTIGAQTAITDTEIVTQTICECSQDKCLTHTATTTVSGRPNSPVYIKLSPTILASAPTSSRLPSKESGPSAGKPLLLTFTTGDLTTIYDVRTLTQTIFRYSQGTDVTQLATTTVSGASNSPVTMRPSETLYISSYDSPSATENAGTSYITLGTDTTVYGTETITQTVFECFKESCLTQTATTTVCGRPEKPVTLKASPTIFTSVQPPSNWRGFANSSRGNETIELVPAVSTEFKGTYIITEIVTSCCNGKCNSQKRTKILTASPSMTATLMGTPTTTVKITGTSTVTIQSIKYSILTPSVQKSTPYVTTFKKTLTPGSSFSGTAITMSTVVTISECNQGKCKPSESNVVPSGTLPVYLQPTTYVSIDKSSTITIHSFTKCAPPQITPSVTTIVSTVNPGPERTQPSLEYKSNASPNSPSSAELLGTSESPTLSSPAHQPGYETSGLEPPKLALTGTGGLSNGSPQSTIRLHPSGISQPKKSHHQTRQEPRTNSSPAHVGSPSKLSQSLPPLQSGAPGSPGSVDLINGAHKRFPELVYIIAIFQFF